MIFTVFVYFMLIPVFNEIPIYRVREPVSFIGAIRYTCSPFMNLVYLMDGGNVIPKLVTHLGEKTIPHSFQR